MQQPSLLPEEFVNETRERRTGLLAAVLFPLVLAAVVGAFFVTNRQWSQVRDAQAAIDAARKLLCGELAAQVSGAGAVYTLVAAPSVQ